ncbi:MAG: hypothetical protein HKN25_15570, partial [Pyrinomonadaceae bacterium]|nr:hypothetical protein [Pyrinomonadaceae bacterium]
MVLTPQLRQRIEMLQMTTLELGELIQQEIESNPLLEEIESGDEIRELAEKILDQNADGTEGDFESQSEEPSGNQEETPASPAEPEFPENGHKEDVSEETQSAIDESTDENAKDAEGDSFDEIDLGQEFQDYLDPGYKTREFEHRDDLPSFEQFLSSSETLTDHLEWQINMLDISEEVEN